jgi:hypothetical protein
MKFKGLYRRWHRFDANNKKIIKRFEIEEMPDPLQEEGYSEWVHGTGPMSEQQHINLVTAVRKACAGVPKTEEHKFKMSIAKLGVPKTEQHKANMRLAQQRIRDARKNDAGKQNSRIA